MPHGKQNRLQVPPRLSRAERLAQREVILLRFERGKMTLTECNTALDQLDDPDRLRN